MQFHRRVRLALGVSATLASVAVVAASAPGNRPTPPVRDVVITVDAGPDAAQPPVVAPGSTDTRQAAHEARRGSVMNASATGPLDLPVAAVGAYRSAATVMGEVDPDCGLSWTLLAAIGRIESDHGRFDGATLGSDGVSAPLIRGVALDGAGPVARVADTDAGLVDGDRRWDRAVGPMQFLPSTWASVGVDADGDGVRSADDLDDAALGAAVFLCAVPGQLDSWAGRQAAVLRYNPSDAYARAVLAVERSYRAGDYELPTLPAYGEDPRTVRTVRAAAPGGAPHAGHHGQPQAEQVTHEQPAAEQVHPGPHPGNGGDHQGGTQPDPTPEPTPDPTPDPTPEPTPEPTPDPTPEPTPDPAPEPVTEDRTGTLAVCDPDEAPAQEQTWCLDDEVLDVGDADLLAADALADFDADGVVETNAEELAGLADAEVTVTVVVSKADDEAPVLIAIGEDAYLPEP